MSNSNICKHLSINENERGMDNGIVDWYCFYQGNYIDPSDCINCKYKKQKEIVYLANPYGFSKQQNEKLLPEIINKIEAL